MALSYSRMFCRRGLDLGLFRGLHTSGPRGIVSTMPKLATAVAETHDEKNARLKRPMSPHLTIYKFPMPAVLSITHRATGMILSGYGMILAGATIFVPGGVGAMIASIDALCLPVPVLFLAKYIIALPATYHYFNGARHLAWDLGKFLIMKEVYTTGYAVIGISIAAALALAAMF